MERRIAELTDQVYKEGVAKGEEEAKRITDEANKKAESIIARAKSDAEKILSDAKTQAEELKRNVESEISLSGKKAVSAIKQQIMDLLSARVIDQPMGETLSDPAVLKDLVLTVAQNWKAQEGQIPSLEVLLPASKKEDMQKSLQSALQKTLKDGVTVTFSRNVKKGFQIGPADGSYKLSLTDDDFSEFFKEYLRPKTRSYLFGE
jgi:V/A-type H+-transporting ATPase subunit E